MKHNMKKLLALLLVIAMVCTCFAACGSSDGQGNGGDSSSTNYDRDTIVVAFTGATSLSPWGTSNNTPGNYEVYEDLFEQGLDNVTYPVLADGSRGGNNSAGIMGYDHEDGTNVYTVYIWDNIYDHKGNHVTADDVKWSYVYQYQNSTTSGWEVFGTSDEIENNIKVIDDTTIEFTFTRELTALGEFEQVFTLCFIVDQETFEGSASKLMMEMIGTGPYKQKQYTPGAELILEANEDYWQKNDEYRDVAQQANVRVIDYKFVNDTITRIMMFKTGEIDMSDDIETLNAEEFMAGPEAEGYEVYTYPAGLIMNLWANCSEESICGDVNMRKAIFYSISSDMLVEMLGGTDEPAYTYSNNTTGDHHDEWNDMENYNSFRGTDEERAAIVQGYLDAAGYNGEEVVLLCQQDMSDFCTILLNMMQNYGINVKLNATDHAGSTAIEQNPGAWDLEYNKWGGNSYIALKWSHAWSWANTVEGDHTTNFVYDSEWNDLLIACNSQEGHTYENMTAWLEMLYDNAYAMNLYNTTKNIIYPEGTELYRNSHLIILPGACTYAS